MHFGRSIKWFLPLNPYVKKSINMLFAIGEKLEREGKNKKALFAYRTVRSSLFACRSFYTPGKVYIETAEKKIENLLLRDKTIANNLGKTFIEKAFNIKTDTNIIWTILMELGLLGWVGTVITYILKNGEIRVYQFSLKIIPYGVIIFLLFYLLWIVGMLKA